MTNQQIINEIRFLTKIESTDVSDDQLLTGLNGFIYPTMLLDILEVAGYRNTSITQATTDVKAYSSLSAGETGYKGEYPFPTNLLKVNRIEISYDGTNFYPASIYDPANSDYSEWNDNDLLNKATQTSPIVKLARDSFFIRPLPTTDVSGGIYIEYESTLSELQLTDAFPFNTGEQYAVLLSILRLSIREPELLSSFIEREVYNQKTQFRTFYRNRFKNTLKLPTIETTYE